MSSRRTFGILISARGLLGCAFRCYGWGPRGEIGVCWRAWRSPAAHKKELEWPPNGLERGARRGRTLLSGAPALRGRHPRYRPHPARHLSRRGAVGHARPLAGGGHGLPALDQPAVALRRVAPHRGRDLLAGREGLRVARGHRDVPGGLDERAAHVGVARAGYPAPRRGLAARVLRGREPAPRGERRRAREPGGVAHLAGEQERGGDVDALHAPERVHGRLPLRPPGGLGDPPRQRVARLLAAPHAVAVVLVGGGVVGLDELDRVGPPPVRPRPVAPPPAGRRRLVEDVAVPQQELRHPLLGALQVAARVGQRAGEVAGRLGALVGHPDLDDVARREQAGEELGVAAVGLAAAVGGRALHLRDGPDGAVEAEGAQGAAEVEAGHAGLVDRLRRLCFATLIFGFSRLIIFGFHVFRQGRTASSPNSQTCPS